MDKRSIRIGLGLLALGCAGSAMAAGYGGGYAYGNTPGIDGLYIGGGVGELIYNEDGIAQLTPTIAFFRVGQQFNRYLAIEGRIGTSIHDGYTDGFRANLGLLYGGYLKGMLPLAPWLTPYAIVGVGGAQIHRNYAGFDTTDAGLSAGVGAEFPLNRAVSLNAEWVRLITNGNNAGFSYTADQLSFGVNWHPYFN
jgi:opacity protein-like surface antigen